MPLLLVLSNLKLSMTMTSQFSTLCEFLTITEPTILMTGIVIFAARIFDVSIGTIGTIVTVQGRSVVAFFLAEVEVAIWIRVVSVIIHQVTKMPILVIFYSLSYATGTVVGIVAERKLAFGVIILKVFTLRYAKEIADAFRRAGQPVDIHR